ncbi:MAG: hypothetical protein PVH68_07505 [Armatimonadota bacterium]|jgi:hypothetical protein
MGTSTFQPSPPGGDWGRVKRGYADPGARAPEIVSRIVQAMDDDFVAGLSSAPVARALRRLMAHAGPLAGAGRDREQLAAVAQTIREEVEDVTAVRRDSSRYGEIALSAVTPTVLASSRLPPGTPLPRTFLATYLAHVFSHIVGRDITRHVGQGQFTGVVEAGKFVHAAEDHVARELQAMELAVLEAAEDEEEISAVLAEIVPRALERLVLEEGEDAS